GIAESAARAGIDVVLYEPERAPLERSEAALAASVERAVRGGKVDTAEAEALVGRVAWTTDLGALGDRDVIVEAVVEDERVKAGVFRELDAIAADHAILASNTSSIPIAGLARVRVGSVALLLAGGRGGGLGGRRRPPPPPPAAAPGRPAPRVFSSTR